MPFFPTSFKAQTEKKSVDVNNNSSGGDGGEAWGVALELTKLVVTTAIAIYLGHLLTDTMKGLLESSNEAAASAKVSKKALAKRLQRPELEDMQFDSYEMALLNDILGPDEIKVTFADIGGMDDQLEEVKDNIVLPMQIWGRFRKIGVLSKAEEELCACPTGMLLYGMPGTGKSLTAQAVAKESGATFMNIKASSFLSKYVGESDRMVSAIFRLSRKLAPTVVFIDEIDTVLRKRSNYDTTGGATQSMQGVFLSEWDGLNQDNSSGEVKETSTGKVHENNCAKVESEKRQAPVVVLGATNRPTDLDDAFLRRMPVKVQTFMPDLLARVAILRAQLRNEPIAEEVDLTEVAAAMDGFSGSDIKEVIRLAKQHKAKRVLRSAREAMALTSDSQPTTNHIDHDTNTTNKNNNASASSAGGMSSPLGVDSFTHALHKVKSSANSTKGFGGQQKQEDFLARFGDILSKSTTTI